MEQDYAFSIAELVNSLIKKHMKTIVLTVKCSETSFLIESSTKYLPLTKK